MGFVESQVPKCEGYFYFAQYRLWGTQIQFNSIDGDLRHPPRLALK
jgi:hypothetical protein